MFKAVPVGKKGSTVGIREEKVVAVIRQVLSYRVCQLWNRDILVLVSVYVQSVGGQRQQGQWRGPGTT